MTMDEKLVDKRVVRRNLERGRIDAAAYRGMLESLPDASANVERTESTSPSSAQLTGNGSQS
jgi:hypothetical protein